MGSIAGPGERLRHPGGGTYLARFSVGRVQAPSPCDDLPGVQDPYSIRPLALPISVSFLRVVDYLFFLKKGGSFRLSQWSYGPMGV